MYPTIVITDANALVYKDDITARYGDIEFTKPSMERVKIGSTLSYTASGYVLVTGSDHLDLLMDGLKHMHEFCRRVEMGEVRSLKTYSSFQSHLKKAADQGFIVGSDDGQV